MVLIYRGVTQIYQCRSIPTTLNLLTAQKQLIMFCFLDTIINSYNLEFNIFKSNEWRQLSFTEVIASYRHMTD